MKHIVLLCLIFFTINLIGDKKSHPIEVAKKTLLASGVGKTAADATGTVVTELFIPLDKVVSALFLKSNPTVEPPRFN